jgi:hypothetical protein
MWQNRKSKYYCNMFCQWIQFLWWFVSLNSRCKIVFRRLRSCFLNQPSGSTHTCSPAKNPSSFRACSVNFLTCLAGGGISTLAPGLRLERRSASLARAWRRAGPEASLRIIHPDLSYRKALEMISLPSLSQRQDELSRSHFKKITKPSHKLHYLLPDKCINNPRNNDNFTHIWSCTNRFKNSYIGYQVV